MKLKFAAVLLALFLAGVAHADGTPAGTLYDINGSMTLTGNGATEVINFWFLLDESTSCPASLGVCVVGSVTTNSSGPLDPFTSTADMNEDHGAYLPFFDGEGDEVDMYPRLSALGVPVPPLGYGDGLGANLWACTSSTCAADFDDGISYAGLYNFDVAQQFTATPAPEPPTATLGLCGILALCLLAARRKLNASGPQTA